MILYLTARANITDLIVDSIEVRLASGREVLLTWDESDIKRTSHGFQARYKGVYFDEEYANGKIDELHGMQILDVTLSSEIERYNLFFIEHMEFEDNEDKVSFHFPIVLSDVCDIYEDISKGEFAFVLSYFFAVILLEEASEEIRQHRIDAFQKLKSYIDYYLNNNFPSALVFGILKRKGMMILCTTSKSELERIIKPRCPHFDGNKFVPDEYHVPQEELIAWSETSLKAPLNQAGHNRYLELFQMIFPKKYEELMINA